MRELPKRRKKKESKSKVFLTIALVFLLAVLWVWKSIEAHKLSRELTQLESSRKVLVENNKQLKADLARLRSISWIDNCVRNKYGMTYEVKERMVLFDKAQHRNRPNRNMFANIISEFIKQTKKVFE